MTYAFHFATYLILAYTLFTLTYIGRQLMATQDQVDALTTQVTKVQSEVTAARDTLTAQVVALQDQLDSAGVADQVDLSGLQSAIQTLDDINPDPAPVDVPAEAAPQE